MKRKKNTDTSERVQDNSSRSLSPNFPSQRKKVRWVGKANAKVSEEQETSSDDKSICHEKGSGFMGDKIHSVKCLNRPV